MRIPNNVPDNVIAALFENGGEGLFQAFIDVAVKLRPSGRRYKELVCKFPMMLTYSGL